MYCLVQIFSILVHVKVIYNLIQAYFNSKKIELYIQLQKSEEFSGLNLI